MTRGLKYEKLPRHLVDAVLEIAERYRILRRDWGDETPGPHVVFGDVLTPYLLGLLTTRELSVEHDALLRRIFAFLEDLARDDDDRVQELVSTTVTERLGSDADALAIGHRYVGPVTRRLSDEIEPFWSGGESHVGAADSIAPVTSGIRRGNGTGSE